MRDYYNSSHSNKYDRAVFLDRDGTINIDTVMPYKEEDLLLFKDTISALRELSKIDAYIIIITNQSGIALKKYSIDEMHHFNHILISKLQEQGVRIDALYFCPHHDKKNFPTGYDGCSCSKPEAGLLLEAKEDFQIDLSQSVLIGDKHTDIGAGINAGCKANILVTTGIYKKGHYNKEVLSTVFKPSYIANNLTEAVSILRRNE